MTINGRNITAGIEKIECTFGPDEFTGKYTTTMMSLQTYELFCKNAVKGFCDCDYEDSELDEKQLAAIQKTIKEVLETNGAPPTVIKEIEVIKEINTVTRDGETRVIREGTDPIILVLIGVVITIFAIGIALFVAWLVLRKRRSNEKIVVVDNFNEGQQ